MVINTMSSRQENDRPPRMFAEPGNPPYRSPSYRLRNQPHELKKEATVAARNIWEDTPDSPKTAAATTDVSPQRMNESTGFSEPLMGPEGRGVGEDTDARSQRCCGSTGGLRGRLSSRQVF